MALRSLYELQDRLAVPRAMQVRREEYLDYMTFRENRRPLFTELFGPLLQTREEWIAQDATPQELDLSAFRYRQAVAGPVPVNTGWLGGPEPRILEETDDYVLGSDQMGRRVKLIKHAASLPLPLDYPVAGMDDWLRVKPHYLFSEERFAPGWETVAREHREAGRVVTVSIPGGFDEPRQLLGEEALCVAYYEQPELIHDILQTLGETAYRVLERVSRTVLVDVLYVHEDLAGKSGPLVGPRQVEEFIAPYYRGLWDLLQERGARLFNQDSDGDMRTVIPAFLAAGINLMHPLEPAAGMDAVKLREQYGTRLAFEGGLDKHALRRGEGAIVAELEYKLPPLIASGGCVISLDHRIPNGTTLAAYRLYLQHAWQILEREEAKLVG